MYLFGGIERGGDIEIYGIKSRCLFLFSPVAEDIMILAISSQLLSLFISFDFFSIKIGVSLSYFLFRRFVKS
jgi:hypothetical protein